MALSGQEKLAVILEAKDAASQEIARLQKKLEDLGGPAMVKSQRQIAKLNREVKLLGGESKKARGIFTRFTNGIAIGNIAATAAIAAFRGVTSAIKGTIRAAMETERAYAKATGALQRHGLATAENEKKLRAFTNSMQTLTGVADEEFATAVGTMVDRGVSLSKAFQLVSATADVAASRGKDMSRSLQAIADAVGRKDLLILEAYGVTIDKTQDFAGQLDSALQQLNKNFGGAAADAADTYAVRAEVLGQKFGDLQEKVGGELLPVLEGLTNVMIASVDVIFAMGDHTSKAASSTETLGEKLNDLAVSIKENVSGLSWLVSSFFTLIKAAALTAKLIQAPFLLLLDSIKYASAAMKALFEGDFAIAAMQAALAGDAIEQSFVADINAIKAAWLQGALEMKIGLDKLFDDAKQGARDLKKELQTTFTVAIPAFIDYEEEIDDATDAMVSHGKAIVKVKGWLHTLKGVARAVFGSIGNAMTTLSQSMTAGISGAVDTMLGEFTWLQEETKGVWKRMAQDFTKHFISSAMNSLMSGLIGSIAGGGILGAIASLFDTAANDRMAKRQGTDFGYYFGRGVMDEINKVGTVIGQAVAGSIVPVQTPTLAFGGSGSRGYSPSPSGPQTVAPVYNINVGGWANKGVLQRDIIPALEQASLDSVSHIELSREHQTGARDVRI